MRDVITGKKILVTGGSGCFGRVLVKEILKYNPAVIRIYSFDEAAQFEMRHQLRGYPNLRFLIGDIREKERLRHALTNVDIVYHLAALKHVESCEYNPFEALKTNAIGTQNLVETVLEERVGRVIFTSTDKAVNPSSTMGASKLLAERLIVAANFYKGDQKTIFSSVRFGNVMGSRGSVIPLFERQINSGGPITITDNIMTRFIISMKDATNLIFKATRIARGGEIFVFKMPVVRLADVVDVMLNKMRNNSIDNGHHKVKVKLIGKLPGEKPYEELMTEEESTRALETSDMYIIIPSFNFTNIKYIYPTEEIRKAKVKEYSSRNIKCLSKKSIERLLSNLQDG